MTQTASTSSDVRHYVLEPIKPALLGVVIVHLLVALILYFVFLPPPSIQSSAEPVSDQVPSSLVWFRPSAFDAQLPLNQSVQQPPAQPQPSSSRYITLSRVNTAATPSPTQTPNPKLPSPSAGAPPDVNTLTELDRIDEALYEAFMQAWTPPNLNQISPSRRSTRLDISLNSDLALIKADLVSPSGSTDLDLSVLLAAERVAERLRNPSTSAVSLKIPKSLPSSFKNSLYVCRIQFQVE